MKKLLIATKNKGKIGEYTTFLSDLPVQLLSLSDLGIKVDVEEDKKTYKENSQKKVLFYARLSGLPTIGDDGGIEIDALGGAPGIKSNRWLGHSATDEELIQNMIKVSKELPNKKRGAYFRAIVSFALPEGKVWSVEGGVKGIIAKKPFLVRSAGYPYRSFFYLPQIKKYYHEKDLSPAEQKLYNHRYKAVQKIKLIIRRILDIK